MGNEHDWLLYLFLFGSLISIILFLVTSGIGLPLLDISMKWSDRGFEITFTGIAEIIVAIGFAIGAIWRLKKIREM